MKVKTAVVIFFLQTAFIFCADVMEEIKPGIQDCCKEAYSDDESAQNQCFDKLQSQLTGSFTASYLLHKKFDSTQYKGEQKKLEDLASNADVQAEMNGKSDEEKRKLVERIMAEHKTELEESGKAARKGTTDKFITKLKEDCKLVAADIKVRNEPEFFTADMFALIVASGAHLYARDEWNPFIQYLKDNSDVTDKLKTQGAHMWQILFYLNGNARAYLNSCQCKGTVFSTDFIKFLTWVFEKKLTDDDAYKKCSLPKFIEIYEDNMEIIKDLSNEENVKVIKLRMTYC